MSRRTERIAEQVLEELASVLRESATDPRLKLVNLLRVDVSPELSNALVYWSMLDLKGQMDLEAAAQGLASASGFLRRELAQRLSGMRRIPELRFRHDPSLALGSRTLSVLSSLSDGEKA